MYLLSVQWIINMHVQLNQLSVCVLYTIIFHTNEKKIKIFLFFLILEMKSNTSRLATKTIDLTLWPDERTAVNSSLGESPGVNSFPARSSGPVLLLLLLYTAVVAVGCCCGLWKGHRIKSVVCFLSVSDGSRTFYRHKWIQECSMWSIVLST